MAKVLSDPVGLRPRRADDVSSSSKAAGLRPPKS
jgi:hypothetical protein